jgi:hypothetical protein
MKVKEFLVDFKNEEILNVKDLGLSNELENEYVNLLNEFFNREVEDRDIVLEDLDKEKGFLYKLMCEWFENEFVVNNELGLVWYEYSLEDLFRDNFGKDDSEFNFGFGLFEIEDINKKLYGDDWDEE